jgi:hypothetical protein
LAFLVAVNGRTELLDHADWLVADDQARLDRVLALENVVRRNGDFETRVIAPYRSLDGEHILFLSYLARIVAAKTRNRLAPSSTGVTTVARTSGPGRVAQAATNRNSPTGRRSQKYHVTGGSAGLS